MPFEHIDARRQLRFSAQPSAGDPAQSEERYEFSLDLNSYIVRNPSSTFFVRVEGGSMEDSGIFSGDLLVVDRSVAPSDGTIVLAVVDGDFGLRRVSLRGGKTLLAQPDSRDTGGWSADSFVWGVVVGSVHKF